GTRGLLSSLSTCRYRIIAGAPGAAASLVIFNSSGEIGIHSSALLDPTRYAVAKSKKSPAIRNNRPKDIAHLHHRISKGKISGIRTLRGPTGKNLGPSPTRWDGFWRISSVADLCYLLART